MERGSGILVGVSEEKILRSAYDLLDNSESLKAIETKCMDQPFGDGKASIRIAEILKEHFDK